MTNKNPEKIANRIKIAAAYAQQHTRAQIEREREIEGDRDQTKLWPEQKLRMATAANAAFGRPAQTRLKPESLR